MNGGGEEIKTTQPRGKQQQQNSGLANIKQRNGRLNIASETIISYFWYSRLYVFHLSYAL